MRIESRALLKMEKATKKRDILMMSEKMYSALPWPKGWSLSPGLEAILLPINVISEENTSPALFKPSAIMAWLLVTKPILSLATRSRVLARIPDIATWLTAFDLFKTSPSIFLKLKFY